MGRIMRSNLLDCLMYQGWTHVVEQNDIQVVRERGAQFVHVCHLDFDPRGATLGGLRGLESCGYASGQADVIFLDQDGFAQVLAMIAAAANADCVLF